MYACTICVHRQMILSYNLAIDCVRRIIVNLNPAIKCVRHSSNCIAVAHLFHLPNNPMK